MYEFPGVYRTWEMARNLGSEEQARNTIYLYFHSKGKVTIALSNPSLNPVDLFVNIKGCLSMAS